MTQSVAALIALGMSFVAGVLATLIWVETKGREDG